MSTVKTGKQGHDDTVNVAESARQSAVLTTTTPKSTVVSADATFHRAAAKSAIANGCGAVPFLTALRENGQSLYP